MLRGDAKAKHPFHGDFPYWGGEHMSINDYLLKIKFSTWQGGQPFWYADFNGWHSFWQGNGELFYK